MALALGETALAAAAPSARVRAEAAMPQALHVGSIPPEGRR
jgi:hypothetical protein